MTFGAVLHSLPPNRAGYGANFNGSTSTLTRGNPTGAANAATSTLSFWAKINTNVTQSFIAIASGGSNIFGVTYNTTGDLGIFGATSSSYSPGFVYTTPASLIQLGVWYHIAWAASITDASGATRLAAQRMYVNGVKQPLTSGFDAGTGGVIGFAVGGATWSVGSADVGTTNFVDGDIADLWFQDGLFIDFDDRALLDKFYIRSGSPAYLGGFGERVTGLQPRIFLGHPVASLMGTNLGTGGDFTPAGVQAATKTSPFAGQP